MKRITRTRGAQITAALILNGFLSSAVYAQVPQDQGVEVLTRGPIHEAFAMPTPERQAVPPVVPKQPPPPINEVPSELRPEGDQAQWIPGYWAWDNDRNDFVWVSGIWRVPPPNHQWVPGYWQPVNGGWQWVSGYWGDVNAAQVNLLPPPPDPVNETPPPPPDNNSIYIPGIWVFQGNQYLWQPGHWIEGQPGWAWTPAFYCWSPGGYIFVNGFWDHDFDQRGLLFAPAFVDTRFVGQPGWFYRPMHVIDTAFLLGSLFVNPGRNHYFFGDYYDRADVTRGFVPWVDYRMRNNVHDSLYNYYRWRNRGNPRWEENLRSTYATRRDHIDQRPPRTLPQQQRAPKGPTVAVPLNRWKGSNFKLEPLQRGHAEEIHKHVQEWRNLSSHRGKVETAARHAEKAPGRSQPVRVEMPRNTIRQPTAVRKPPPHPAHPKPEKRPHK